MNISDRIKEISSLSEPELQIYASLTEAQLCNYFQKEQGIFIAESPKVIQVALRAGYEPISLLCERRHIENDAADIIRQCPDIPIYTGEREILNHLTGYKLTRGVLCAMRRKPCPTLQTVLYDAHRVCVIDAVCDTTNIGAIFRSVFLVPRTWLDSYNPLRELGFCTAAMALTDNSIALDDPILKQQSRLAIIMGTEGDGLPKETINGADFVVRIPMFHAVDSLNVAAAAAVAFWELRMT